MGAKKGPKLAFGLKSNQSAVKAPAVFAPDSDDERDPTEQDQKRQRTTEAAGHSAPPLAAADLTAEEQQTAEKLAEFVAKHGRSFEEVTRQRNPHGGPFKFLFETNSPGYKHYERRLQHYTGNQPQGSFLAATPMPAPPPLVPRQPIGVAVVQGVQTPRPPLNPPPSLTVPAMGASTEMKKAKAASGDSLAAMEAFTKLAAKRDEAKEEEEAKQPLLNETSYDRRRTIAVYKHDGSRGHHMQDYIPQEELAKFLAKSGSEEAKAQAEALEAASRIQSDNVGHRLLSQMGWKEGQGLGAQGKGMAAPVAAASGFASEKRGLGAEDHLAPQEGDDEFEAYRKRMMLGYKHRPNPLGNPRKSYY